jgi:hypothetical protein
VCVYVCLDEAAAGGWGSRHGPTNLDCSLEPNSISCATETRSAPMGEGICEQWRPSFASSRSAESTRVATSCMTVLSAWQRVLSSMALRRHRTAADRCSQRETVCAVHAAVTAVRPSLPLTTASSPMVLQRVYHGRRLVGTHPVGATPRAAGCTRSY